MSEIKKRYVTKSNISYIDAIVEHEDRFIWLNMHPDGLWFVDKQHPNWEKIKETALAIAEFHRDKETVDKLLKL